MKNESTTTNPRYPKSVSKILVIKPAASEAEKSERIEVSTGERKRKKKISRALRPVDRELNALLSAAQTYFDSYEQRHTDSASRKKDGALKDYRKNSRRARKDAAKALRKRSKLFKKLRPPKLFRSLGKFKF